jgi:hypothetical protein
MSTNIHSEKKGVLEMRCVQAKIALEMRCGLHLMPGFSDYLRKIIVQGRSSKSTKVGDIMTEEVFFPLSVYFERFLESFFFVEKLI